MLHRASCRGIKSDMLWTNIHQAVMRSSLYTPDPPNKSFFPSGQMGNSITPLHYMSERVFRALMIMKWAQLLSSALVVMSYLSVFMSGRTVKSSCVQKFVLYRHRNIAGLPRSPYTTHEHASLQFNQNTTQKYTNQAFLCIQMRKITLQWPSKKWQYFCIVMRTKWFKLFSVLLCFTNRPTGHHKPTRPHHHRPPANY